MNSEIKKSDILCASTILYKTFIKKKTQQQLNVVEMQLSTRNSNMRDYEKVNTALYLRIVLMIG